MERVKLVHHAVIVFTAKSIDRLLREGGTSSWRLDRNHARKCTYAVCTRNANADWVEGPEEHHSAFLVGKVSDVVPCPEYADKSRYLVQFSEFARVNIPDAWKGDRNPVKYGTLQELGIDPSTLKWEAMPVAASTPAPTSEKPVEPSPVASGPLTMAEAKKGLALTFGVAPEAIEITIRG
jgi:hypothetical protein